MEKFTGFVHGSRASLETEVRNAYAQVRIARLQSQQARAVARLAEKSLAMEKEKYRLGLSSALNITQLRNQLLDARLGVLQSDWAFRKQCYDVTKIVGVTLQDWKISV